MTLAALTQYSVRRALDQFHELGREAFLQRYGFGKAISFLTTAQHRYDRKPNRARRDKIETERQSVTLLP